MNGLREKFRNKKGFTLIEMLIVVAIIAILVAVSIPLIGNALESARDATDQANERAAKAEALLTIMDVADLPTGVTWDATANTATAYYNAAEGKLVAAAANAGQPYGQCTGAGSCYVAASNVTKGPSGSNEGCVLKLTLNRADGTVTMEWVKP